MANSTNTIDVDANIDDEFEEITMILELNGVLDADAVRTAAMRNELAIRNANSGEPLVQLGNSLYSGKWTQTLGSDLILASSSHDMTQLEFVATSDTRLTCDKALLNSQNPQGANGQSQEIPKETKSQTNKSPPKRTTKPKKSQTTEPIHAQ